MPLYLSQALAVAMYIFGLREGWTWQFPEHDPLIVDLAVFGVTLTLAYIRANLSFRVQYLVMAVIALSLFSVFENLEVWQSERAAHWFGSYPGGPENDFQGTRFWGVFAVFFPAATGIMAGANMPGELKNPRKCIPFGPLSAIALSTAIYLALAVWAALAASPDALVRNYTIVIDRALWGSSLPCSS